MRTTEQHNYWQNLYAKQVREDPRKLSIEWVHDAFLHVPVKK